MNDKSTRENIFFVERSRIEKNIFVVDIFSPGVFFCSLIRNTRFCDGIAAAKTLYSMVKSIAFLPPSPLKRKSEELKWLKQK